MDTTQGRDWLTMNAAHFDAKLLPKRLWKIAEHQGLFDLADVVALAKRESRRRPEQQIDGQADLFSETEQT